MEGRIIKGVGGFYYVHTPEDEIYACRAAGIFRKEGIKPLVGDLAEFVITCQKDMEGSLTNIKKRKNVLIRPAAANIDFCLIVSSIRHPAPDFNLIDRVLIYMEAQKIPVLVYFNKTDLAEKTESAALQKVYRDAGYEGLSGSIHDEGTLIKLRERLRGRTTVLAGASGVGKSSLVNALCLKEYMEVGELSRKIMRGKQTTRHAQLVRMDAESFILDTPGFSSFDLSLLGIRREQLAGYYEEFGPFTAGCRYRGCSHVNEPADICSVKDAVRKGKISPSRYESYVRIYRELSAMERR